MSTVVGFSVVITSYNYQSFIEQAVDSALAQAHAPVEVLVVDDGSTDGTVAFLQNRYRDTAAVRVIATTNNGQLSAFLTGAQQARGDIVAFLDADDTWQSDYLEKINKIYNSNPRIDFIYSNMRFFGTREGLLIKNSHSRDLGLSILMGAYHTQWQASATSGISLKKSIALRILDLPPEMLQQWRTRADDCLACGADILGARKYYLADASVNYRAHGSNAWLNEKFDGSSALKHWLRVEAMLEFYRQRAQLPSINRSAHLRHAKHEFLSKPQPNYKELRVYSTMIRQSSLPFFKRLEHRFSLWRHFFKNSRSAS